MEEKYLILGAGPSGILTAARFKNAGIPFDWVEKGHHFGGMWDNQRQTAAYSSAHFISSKTMSGFLDFPMPEDYPDYPNHEKILKYIKEYVAFHSLQNDVEFGQEVTLIEKNDNNKYQVSINNNQKSYGGVVIANGRNWFPNDPEYPGEFKGEAYHSFYYNDPMQLLGKNVLIIGAGNSGCEIACDAAKFAKTTYLSQRRGYYYLPKYVFGMPSDVFASKGPKLPPRLEQRVFQFLINRIVVGDLTKFGLPRPDHRILESHPIMNTLVLRHIGHGDIVPKPDVDKILDNQVEFRDGSVEDIDLIIYATGYKQEFPFIDPALLDIHDGVPDLYFNIFPRKEEGIFVIGYLETDGGLLPHACLQADLVTNLITCKLTGNSKKWNQFHQKEKQKRPNLKGGMKYIDSPRHNYYTKADVYEKKLKNLIRHYACDQ